MFLDFCQSRISTRSANCDINKLIMPWDWNVSSWRCLEDNYEWSDQDVECARHNMELIMQNYSEWQQTTATDDQCLKLKKATRA